MNITTYQYEALQSVISELGISCREKMQLSAMFSHIVGKESLTAEDLKLQLGSILPQATALMAQAAQDANMIQEGEDPVKDLHALIRNRQALISGLLPYFTQRLKGLASKYVVKYTVKVYVKFGYFSYDIDDKEKAMNHAQAITESRVYRRVNKEGDVEFHTPLSVKVCGEGLGSQYQDEFNRT